MEPLYAKCPESNAPQSINSSNAAAMPYMSNMDIKSLTLCIITLFGFCCSVDVDYYSDKDPVDNETDRTQNNQRTDDEILKDVDVTAKNLTYARSAHGNSTNSTSKPNRKYNYDINDQNKYVQFKDAFDDYAYQYPDDRAEDLLDLIRSTTPANVDDVDSVEFPKLNNSNLNADIYNLEPVISKFGPINKTLSRVDTNVWYVQEEYPCWRLPLVFGRRKHQFPWAKIFSLTGPELQDIKLEKKYKQREHMTPRNHIYFDDCNQWCKLGPCYGDHTLCIFPTNRISTICGHGYKVIQLTQSERWTVTNSINKIRNRVAMGQASSNLPSATNMQLIQYDKDLAMMSNRWLRQCLPGPAPCAALNNGLVTQLECLKSMRNCCLNRRDQNCIAPAECFVSPLVGCIHSWFLSGNDKIRNHDIKCGYITRPTFSTAQILWAHTNKVGCAYAEKENGDIRVVCNFSPGARFFITSNYYCGVIPHSDITDYYKDLPGDLTDLSFMAALGNRMHVTNLTLENWKNNVPPELPIAFMPWGVSAIHEILKEDHLRQYEDYYENGTIGAVARLVVKYSFFEETDAKCDTPDSIYEIGPTASQCTTTSRIFTALCFEYRGNDQYYRISAILAPVALFSLILYDLFNGVVRQTNF